MMRIVQPVLLLAATLIVAFTFKQNKPVLYIIGDSTVKNGDGNNAKLLQGWGSFIGTHFDTTKIAIENHAIGGRSSRTFLTDGRWDKILSKLKKGDYVMMQFGHNDAGPLDDTARARGTLKGVGDDSTVIYNPIRKQKETVYTYGRYMRKYVNDARASGATAIVCSPIPRNDWQEGNLLRSNDSYALWAKQVAEQTGAYFIDLNNVIADAYEKIGREQTSTFFPQEHTHTNKAGAMFNAGIVVREVKATKPAGLENYLVR